MKHKSCEMCGREIEPRTAVETMRIALASLQRTETRVHWRKAHAEWRDAARRNYQARARSA
jgi:ribosome-binding protein aMBF1 (putative translation factor)